MKKIFSILTIVSAFIFAAAAQDNGAGKMQNGAMGNQVKHSKKDRKNMMKDLDLTKSQKQQMKEFMRSTKAQKEAIQNDKSLTEQQKKQKMMDLRRDQQEKMNAILTPEQREKMKEKMMENKGKYPRSPKQRDPVVTNPDNK